MSEEHTSRLWVCTRCGRRKNIELEPDPVLLKVCDECKIQNWCRNPKGAGVELKEQLQKEDQEETVLVAESVPTEAEVAAPEPDPEEEAKQAEIEALKAQLAELEKDE